MNKNIIILILGTWILFMILAIINAGIRNWIFKSFVGDLTAHQISTTILIVIILAVTYLILRISNLKLSDTEALFIGIIWIILTISFEFIAGHYIFGNSWEKLFADYNILRGRVWSLVLITTLLAPYLTSKLL